MEMFLAPLLYGVYISQLPFTCFAEKPLFLFYRCPSYLAPLTQGQAVPGYFASPPHPGYLHPRGQAVQAGLSYPAPNTIKK